MWGLVNNGPFCELVPPCVLFRGGYFKKSPYFSQTFQTGTVWNQTLKPAVRILSWWFYFDPYPYGAGCLPRDSMRKAHTAFRPRGSDAASHLPSSLS